VGLRIGGASLVKAWSGKRQSPLRSMVKRVKPQDDFISLTIPYFGPHWDAHGNDEERLDGKETLVI